MKYPLLAIAMMCSCATAPKNAFWSTWWASHAAFAADQATTVQAIHQGHHETDHLYTQFGNRNTVGVIGSAVAIHAVISIFSLALHRTASKRRGWTAKVLETLAIGINGGDFAAHTYGAVYNLTSTGSPNGEILLSGQPREPGFLLRTAAPGRGVGLVKMAPN